MRNVQPYIIIALTITIVLLLLFKKSPKSDNEPFERELASRSEQIRVLGLQNQSLIDSIKLIKSKETEEKAVFNAKLEAKNREISKLRTRSTEQRKEVQPLIDSFPALQAHINTIDSTVAALDSANRMKDVRIAGLELTNGKLSLNITALQANFDEAMKLRAEQFALAEAENERLDKEVKKEIRKKKLAQVLIPVVGIGAFLLGAQ
jgi:chromosome segregation ATPase